MSFLRKSGYTFGLCGFLCLASLVNGQTQTPPQLLRRRRQNNSANACQKQPQPSPRRLRCRNLKFRKVQVDNGLEVILFRRSSAAAGGGEFVVPRRTCERGSGRTGFAHLFEHMMFEGSRHVPGSSHFHYLEAAGSFGTSMARRILTRTNYFETLPSNQLELALWLESDRMGYLPDKLDQANLSNQQDYA